jgi:hypothetical protein
MLASRIFVVPITSVSPSTMRGTPEITSAACVTEVKNASSKAVAKLIDAGGRLRFGGSITLSLLRDTDFLTEWFGEKSDKLLDRFHAHFFGFSH